MQHFLIQIFENLITLDEKEKKILCSLFKELRLNKGEYFLIEGEINNYVALIKQGLVRYFVLKNEEEATLEFSKEGEFIGEYESFRDHSKAIQHIQAIEDTILLIIENEGIQFIFDNFKDGNKFGRLALEHRFNHLIKQLLSIYMHNSEQRYVNFIKTYPDLIQRVPQYYIASYVGVKPESLSRIRKRLFTGIS